MEEWGRAMEELAPDDPLNAFHEIFHRHVAVIMRFGRFPHRNKILQPGEHARPRRSSSQTTSFRFDLPLVRQPDGTLAFAGTVRKRTVKLLDHEYQTLLPGADEAERGAFEFNYAGTGRASSPARRSSSSSRASSASATSSPTSRR